MKHNKVKHNKTKYACKLKKGKEDIQVVQRTKDKAKYVHVWRKEMQVCMCVCVFDIIIRYPKKKKVTLRGYK